MPQCDLGHHEHAHMETPHSPHSHTPHCHHSTHKHLLVLLSLTSVFMFGEFFGGLWTGSLALVSDAGHMLSDVASLWISSIALRMRLRAPTLEKTYGYQRAEVLAAFFNALVLMAMATMILIEALERFAHPEPVMAKETLFIAFVGLGVNLFGIKLLHPHTHNMNIRGAYLHVVGDLLGSVATIVSGVVMLFTRWYAIDTIVSLLITGLLLAGGFKLLWDTTHILMQGAPKDLDLEGIKRSLAQVSGVHSVEHLHVWRLSSDILVASVHVGIGQLQDFTRIQTEIIGCLKSQFGINHPTVQIDLKS